jgi:opacity protein-like surface antigen
MREKDMKKRSFLVVLLIVLVNVAFAGDVSRKGTNGAEQLLVPVGAKSIATGGAFIGDVKGVEAIYYNPAGLDLAGRSEAMFSYMDYLADIKVSYFALSANLGDYGTFGLSLKTFNLGDIPVTTFENPDGTGSTYSPSLMTAGLTYSKQITDRVTAGATLKVIYEAITNVSATGAAIDFGVQYKFPNNMRLGVAVTNIGTNMTYRGPDLQVKNTIPGNPPGAGFGVYEPSTEEFQIPSYFELSTSYKYDFNQQNYVMFAGKFTNNNFFEDVLSFGLEYGFLNTFFLRGGYNYLLGSKPEDNIYGLTLGAGVSYNFEGTVYFDFDYAYRAVRDFPTGAQHVFTVKLGL